VVALATGSNAACSRSRPHGSDRGAWRSATRQGCHARAAGRTERVAGEDALEALATRDDVDLVIVGTGGVVSLRPVLAALPAGKVVATANKETLVAGGHLVMPLRAGSRPTSPRRRRDPSRARSPGSGRSTPSIRRSGSAWSASGWPPSRR
jgi:1-deoxy-D-xylulose 5-phosphate reductoisomerase